MNEGTLIRIPVHMWENVEKVRKAKREFVGSGRKPRSDDLALASGLKRKRVEECLWILGGMTVSFEHPIGEGATLGDVVGDVLPSAPGPEQALWAALAREELLGLIDACEFKDRDREILFLRFGFADGVPWILEEIGKRFGLTRERIRQIEKRALEALRLQAAKDADDGGWKSRTRVRRRTVSTHRRRPGSDGRHGPGGTTTAVGSRPEKGEACRRQKAVAMEERQR